MHVYWELAEDAGTLNRQFATWTLFGAQFKFGRDYQFYTDLWKFCFCGSFHSKTFLLASYLLDQRVLLANYNSARNCMKQSYKIQWILWNDYGDSCIVIYMDLDRPCIPCWTFFIAPSEKKSGSSLEECLYLRAESCKLYLPSPISYLWAVITGTQSFNLKYMLHYIKKLFSSRIVFLKICLWHYKLSQIFLKQVFYSTIRENKQTKLKFLFKHSMQVMTSCKCFSAYPAC